MSAQELKREGDGSIRCPYCGSDALNPKLGQGDDVWVTLCESCGIREPMVWPRSAIFMVWPGEDDDPCGPDCPMLNLEDA